jgi:glycosyltransferase involved in cell wall biosynthesis
LSTGRHIAFVTETYPPEVNGVAMTLEHLVNGVLSIGHRVTLFRPRQESAQRPVVNGSITEHLLPGFDIPLYRELRAGMPSGRRLTGLWKTDRPDAVYVATEGPLGWSAARAASKLGIPTVSGFHTNFHTYSNYYGLKLLEPVIFNYLRALHCRTGCTLVPTAAVAAELGRHRFGQVELLTRGVDTELFNPGRRNAALRKQWALSDSDIACLYVGRIAAEKNIAEVISAYRDMQPRCRGKLILVGDGPMRKQLQRKHPDIIFSGIKRHVELAEHYACGDIFLFPSHSETYGNVVTEAMASGLAVVAYDEAAAHEVIVTGRNGMLVDPGCRTGFEATASRLCTDSEKIAVLGKAAARCAATLSWARIVARFVELLERQIARTPA